MNATRLLLLPALLGLATPPCHAAGRDVPQEPDPKSLRGLARDHPGIDLAKDDDLRFVVARMRERAEERRAMAEARAKRQNFPLRFKDGAGLRELVDFDGDRPVYYMTRNVNAARSLNTQLLQAAPFGADGLGLLGDGMTLGIWDGGPALQSHQEFKDGTGLTRVILGDRPAWTSDEHATHVGGTLIAAGVTPAAKGMAPKAKLLSYDWFSDLAEMTANGATGAAQPNKIMVSNHSYGEGMGWHPMGVWTWFGTIEDASRSDAGFGRYSAKAAELDALAEACPYYTVFRAVGNDDADTPPAGAQIRMSPAEGSPVELYDPAVHPPGDSTYLGGFGTMGYDDCAKNIVSVGSVNDPVAPDGTRDLRLAVHTFFSSKGPTDDGRIKPDVCGNGWRVLSSVNKTDSAYDSFSGTSMASPNVCGTAALLIQHHRNLFGGNAMRNHTLKCLLEHTADDLGNKGPDYTFGWGLVNAKAAADLLTDHKNNPSLNRLTVGTLTPSQQTLVVPLIWDGISPLKATLCWTDPAAPVVTQHDSRTPQLVNDLDLKIIAPNGSEFMPWVMPFVDDWSVASLALPAVTGRNKTDNTEQVYVAQPYLSGIYQVVVSHTGTLRNNAQSFSLCLSGGALAQPPPPPPFTVTGVTVPFGYSGQKPVIAVSGTNLRADTRALLRRAGADDVPLTNQGASGTDWKFGADLTGVATGVWDLVFINPYNDTITLPGGYHVLREIWRETFDRTALAGWTTSPVFGSSAWARNEGWSVNGVACHSVTHNSSKNTTQALSPVVNVPADATRLIVSWQNDFSVRSDGTAGLRVEWSSDNGITWNQIDTADSPLVVSGIGYNGTLGAGTTGSGLKAMVGARSGETGLYFPPVMAAQFAGKAMRFRWTFYSAAATGNSTARFDALRVSSDAGATLPSVTVASAFPSSVLLKQSATVHIKGANFAEGAKVYLRRTGSGFSASQSVRVVRLNSGELIADLPAIQDIYARNLIVINPDGDTGMLENGITAVADPGFGIGLGTITPAYGRQGTTVTCLIQGNGFSSGMAARLTYQSLPGIAADSVTVLSPTLAEATFSLGAATPGDRSLELTSAAGVTVLSDGVFAVLPAGATLPATLLSASPGHCRTGAPVRLTLAGAFFKPGSTVALAKAGAADIPGTALDLTSAGRLDATFDVTAATAGAWNVVLTEPDGSAATLLSGLLVNPAPTVVSCTPNACYQGQSTQVTITGNYFLPGATAKLKGPNANIDVTGASVTGAGTLTGTVTVPAAILTGLYAVEVTNPDAQAGSTSGLFNVKSSSAVEITSVSPMRIPAGKASVITVTGANIKAGCSAKLTRSTTTYTAVSATTVSPTRLDCTFQPGASAWVGGPYTLTVTTADGRPTDYPNLYIDAAEPTINQVTASAAQSGTAPRIFLYGANVATVTDIRLRKSGCADIVATGLNIVTSSGYVSFDLNLAGAEAGLWDLAVTNQTGYVVTAAKAFTVTPLAGQPSLTSVSPDSGFQGAAVSLALTGTNFATGCTVKLKRTGVADAQAATPVVHSATAMTASLDLTGVGPGVWDVVVTNAAGQTATLGAAFTVAPAAGITFDAWRNGRFTAAEIGAGSAAPATDFDHDGLSNLMEYAIGTDPKTPTPPPAVRKDSTGLWFELTRPPGGRSDIIYAAESTRDLITWQPVMLESYVTGTTERIRVRDPLTAGDTSTRFLRLRVQLK